MRNYTILILLALLIQAGIASGQDDSRSYFTSGTEFIFSFASIDNQDVEGNNVMRFTGFFHLQGMYNYDLNQNFGLFAGLALRNVGFIEDYPESGEKKKYRTYNVGIPLGFKLGAMKKTHMYAGYEIEFPTNYKEKTFLNEVEEDKFNVWFSKRTPVLYHSLLVGVQLPYGVNLKFKYYLTNFFNESYSEVNDLGEIVYPYEGKDVRIFYISLSFNLFGHGHFIYMED